MRIVIVGCGKVGSAIAEQLSAEEHHVTIVDTDKERVDKLTQSLDVMGVIGNGSSVSLINEIGADAIDVFIAVTGSDELNLIACMFAKKVANCYTIARVRNPVYYNEIEYIKKQMEIETVINPEFAAAHEIARLLRFPSASKIDTFANGKVRLIKFEINPGNILCNLALKDLSKYIDSKVLVCAVERSKQVLIPTGDFIFQSKDIVTFLATTEEAHNFMLKMKMRVSPVRNVIVVGGGTICEYLTKELIDNGISVKIIEKNSDKCNKLSEQFPKASVLHNDGTDREFLDAEGLSTIEAFVSLMNVDEENLILSMYAKKHTNGKVIAKVNRFEFDDVLSDVDIGTLVYPKYFSCDQIVQTVRALHNKAGSNIKTLYRILDDRVEALEFTVQEDSTVTGVPLSKLKKKDNLLICCITRKDQIIIPRGNDCIEKGDSVIVVSLHQGLHDIQDILR